MVAAACRLCGEELTETFVDLGMSPLCESYLRADQLDGRESFYPLHVRICTACLLVQLPAYVPGEDIFSEYAYFSSYSDSWVAHAKRYADTMVDQLGLGPGSLVTEVASNDGYLLQHFVARGIPVLGVEPAANIAEVARAKGIRTETRFLGARTGAELAAGYGRADLVVGNNVYAHVPDLVGFTAGLAALVKPEGLITLEFPHLLRLIERRQYDTIYHEHYQYLSLLTAARALATSDLAVVDVEELPTHGGSLRIFGCHDDDVAKGETERAGELLEREESAGYSRLETYLDYGMEVSRDKRRILSTLIELKDAGQGIVGYGAPAKGNTLLNYCGIGLEFLDYTVDLSPHKQGRFLPGTHIPIRSPDAIRETRPDLVLILPWNLNDEIMSQLSFVRDWGGRFLVREPDLRVV
jgi:SAM-dependent methyltransferase